MTPWTLNRLNQTDQVADRLVSAGLSPDAARSKADLFAKSAQTLSRAGYATDEPCVALFVPGRIEVLGKHTDYAGGSSLLCATEVGFVAVVVPRRRPSVVLLNVAADEQIGLALEVNLEKRPAHWSNYPITVIRRLVRDFGEPLQGGAIAFLSDLPPAAGVSSSSALIVSMFLALSEINDLASRESYQTHIRHKIDLAGYLGAVESGYPFGSLSGDGGVGLFGGSEDHTALLCSEPNHLVQYSYCPVRFQRSIPLPESHTFAIASCGVQAEKAGAAREKYNRASLLATALGEVWRAATGRNEPHLAAALATSTEAADQLREIVRTTPHDSFDVAALAQRLEHFIQENQEILPQALDALARGELNRGDLKCFGQLVDRSQRGAEELLGNQIEPTCYLAAQARKFGAVAASAFGAGFGGSVWALIEKSQAGEFLSQWKEDYNNEFPAHAAESRFLLTNAGPAAFRL